MNKLYNKEFKGNSHLDYAKIKNPRNKDLRNTKTGIPRSMHTGKDNSGGGILQRYNFDPLFKYLLKQVGKNWNEVWKDIYPRVDSMSEPIRTMVVNVRSNGTAFEIDPKKNSPRFWYGSELSQWSTLYVDNDGILRFIDKDYKPKPIFSYGKDWQTFNSKTLKYETGTNRQN